MSKLEVADEIERLALGVRNDTAEAAAKVADLYGRADIAELIRKLKS